MLADGEEFFEYLETHARVTIEGKTPKLFQTHTLPSTTEWRAPCFFSLSLNKEAKVSFTSHKCYTIKLVNEFKI